MLHDWWFECFLFFEVELIGEAGKECLRRSGEGVRQLFAREVGDIRVFDKANERGQAACCHWKKKKAPLSRRAGATGSSIPTPS